ncbi:MAG TPA: protein kinase [Candidatus Obscuribacterales bacterium]
MSETTAPSDQYIGKVLAERYRILGLLGRGRFSVVYKAHHLFMDRMVALKTLKKELLEDERVIKRFEREAVVLSKLRHPNIVTVYDCFVHENGHPFLVMDYLDGPTLDSLIATKGPVPARLAKPIMMQACSGLHHAHQHGVLHRDIRPENIVLLPKEKVEERVRLLDFGFALLEGDIARLTNTGIPAVNPSYMSPERWLGQDLDVRSDIYSLGMVMYKALTGHPPFHSNDYVRLKEMHLNQVPAPIAESRPDLVHDKDLQRIIGRALAKDPDQRFQSMREFLAVLKQWLPREESSKDSSYLVFDQRERNELAAAQNAAPAQPDQHRAAHEGPPPSPLSQASKAAAQAAEANAGDAAVKANDAPPVVSDDTGLLISSEVPAFIAQQPKPPEKVVPLVDRRRKSTSQNSMPAATAEKPAESTTSGDKEDEKLVAQVSQALSQAAGVEPAAANQPKQAPPAAAGKEAASGHSVNTMKLEHHAAPALPYTQGSGEWLPLDAQALQSETKTAQAPSGGPMPHEVLRGIANATSEQQQGDAHSAQAESHAQNPTPPSQRPNQTDPFSQGLPPIDPNKQFPGSQPLVDPQKPGPNEPAKSHHGLPRQLPPKRMPDEERDAPFEPNDMKTDESGADAHQAAARHASASMSDTHGAPRAVRKSEGRSAMLDRHLKSDAGSAEKHKLRQWAETKRKAQSLLLPAAVLFGAIVGTLVVTSIINSSGKDKEDPAIMELRQTTSKVTPAPHGIADMGADQDKSESAIDKTNPPPKSSTGQHAVVERESEVHSGTGAESSVASSRAEDTSAVEKPATNDKSSAASQIGTENDGALSSQAALESATVKKVRAKKRRSARRPAGGYVEVEIQPGRRGAYRTY